jgi:D-sedoheptulose 7-phosphate isomerase
MDFRQYVAENNRVFDELDSTSVGQLGDALRGFVGTDSTLWVLGNGGSSATASHVVADFVKTISTTGGRTIRTVALSELLSLQTAFANDVSFQDGFSETLRLMAKPGDAILLISVSGLSPNLVKASEFSKSVGIRVFSMVGSRGNALAEASEVGVVVPSDDYQIVENIHLALIHWYVKYLERD